jgi:predicted amidohydrolase YtcJ
MTMDLARPGAGAFAIENGRVVAVGDRQSVLGEAPRGASILDFRDCDVVPGFHDAHTHLSGGALELAGIDLRAAASSGSIAEAVRLADRKLPPGAWVRGFGWDETRWAPGDRPSRSLLDRAAPGRPVLLSRTDVHVVWLNTAALDAVGKLQEGSTGLLRDAEATAARKRVPLPPKHELESMVKGAIEQAARHGITSFEDVVEPWSLPVYQGLASKGDLRLRVGAWLPLETEDAEAAEWRRRYPSDDPRLSCSVRKVFLDGTLGARTAALRSVYSDDPSTAGSLLEEPDELVDRMRRLAGGGWAMAVHAVGDRAVDVALDLLRGLPRPPHGRRHRIEHAQLVSSTAIERMVASDLVVSVQPAHWLEDRRWIARRVGSAREAWLYPWRRLVDAGVAVALGSDWPVASLDPRVTLAVAVRGGRSREEWRVRPGPPPGREGELLDFQEALAAYTTGPARASGDEDRGILREGSRADFVVIAPSGPGGTGDPEGWSVRATYVAGQRVWPDPEPSEV